MSSTGMLLDSRLPPRFWDKVRVDESTGCWLWLAYTQPSGYGRYDVSGRFVSAHRHAYSTLVGEIPEGLYADHICCVRRCVNPEHIDIVTHQENIRRAGWRKTVCKHGHEYTPSNTYVHPSGKRKGCRLCRKARMLKFKNKRKGLNV